MKKFKDYHLYLGCKFIGKYKGWVHENNPMFLCLDDLRPDKFEYIKLVLRPLSSMTDEELCELVNICLMSIYGYTPSYKVSDVLSESDNSRGVICFTTDLEKKERYGLTIEYNGIEFSIDSNKMNIPVFSLVTELLKLHFDLFGLIESGEALDSTTV